MKQTRTCTLWCFKRMAPQAVRSLQYIECQVEVTPAVTGPENERTIRASKSFRQQDIFSCVYQWRCTPCVIDALLVSSMRLARRLKNMSKTWVPVLSTIQASRQARSRLGFHGVDIAHCHAPCICFALPSSNSLALVRYSIISHHIVLFHLFHNPLCRKLIVVQEHLLTVNAAIRAGDGLQRAKYTRSSIGSVVALAGHDAAMPPVSFPQAPYARTRVRGPQNRTFQNPSPLRASASSQRDDQIDRPPTLAAKSHLGCGLARLSSRPALQHFHMVAHKVTQPQ